MSYATEKQRFQSIWQDALAQYTLRSGIDLGLCGSSAHSPESLLALLEQDLSKFNAFRDRKAKVWNATKPFLDVVQLFVEKADTASAFAPPPFDSVTKIILTAVGVLIQGAKDVSESYDQIVDLFETLNSTLVRFKTYLEDNITPPLRDVIVDALVQLLLILGITRKMTSKGRIRQFVKSVMGRNKDAKDAVANFEKILTRENLAVVASIYSDTRAIRNDTEAIREAIGVRRQGRDESRLAVKLCPAPTALFTGRQDVLRQMRSFFFDLPLDRHTFVLHGLGGAGKTQIACRFVTEAMKDGNNKFSSAFFVDASSTDTISTDLSLIAKAKNHGTDAQSALHWFVTDQSRWLIVFDNADDPAINLHEYFPSCAHGNILITTRNHDMIRHATPGSESSFRVSDMDPGDAVELLVKAANVLSSDHDSKNHAIQLAQELGHFALALIQASAYMVTMQYSIFDYLRLFKERRGQFLEKYLDVVQRSDIYGATVYTTWRISYDHLNPFSKDLLHICSFLHHEDILLEYFELAAIRCQEYEPEAPFTDTESAAFATTQAFLSHFQNEDHSWNETKFRDTAHDLISYSLVHFNIKKKAYSIHPLVQEWCQAIGHTAITRVSVQAILSMLITWDTSAEVLSFKRKLLPHVSDALSMEDSELSLVPNIADHLESVYSEAGSWMMAQKLKKVALEYVKEAKGTEDPATLTKMNNLAYIYQQQGQLNEAEKLEKEVLEIWKRVLGPEHPDTLISMGNLASIYCNQHLLNEAEKLEKEVLETRKRVLGPEHPDTLTSMNNLALTYQNHGQLNEAQKLQKEVWEIMKWVLGPEHPDTLSSMNNLATVYMAQGQLNEAEKLEKEVLEIRKRVLGPEHPATLSSMNNLASTYWDQGQLNEAEKLHKEVLEIRKRVLGPEHPDTLASMNNLASTYWKQGQLNEAEKLHKEVLEITKRVLGPEHPGTLTSIYNLASTYRDQGQLNEAEKLLKEVLEIMSQVLGPEHPTTLSTMNNLAYTYSQQKRWAEAVELMTRTVEGMKQVLGNEHPNTIGSIEALEDFQLALHKQTQQANDI